MPKNRRGQLSVGQKVLSIVVGLFVGIVHAVLKSKGIDIPDSPTINPATTGGAAYVGTATILKASGEES